MKFIWEGKEFKLRGIEGKTCKIIISQSMTKLLNKQQRGVIAQLCSLDVLGPGIDQFCERINKFCLRQSTVKWSKSKAQCEVWRSEATERTRTKHGRSSANIVKDMQLLNGADLQQQP